MCLSDGAVCVLWHACGCLLANVTWSMAMRLTAGCGSVGWWKASLTAGMSTTWQGEGRDDCHASRRSNTCVCDITHMSVYGEVCAELCVHLAAGVGVERRGEGPGFSGPGGGEGEVTTAVGVSCKGKGLAAHTQSQLLLTAKQREAPQHPHSYTRAGTACTLNTHTHTHSD